MVEENGPENSFDRFASEQGGEPASAQKRDGHVIDFEIADSKHVDSPAPNTRCLSAGERALSQGTEVFGSDFPGKLGVDNHLCRSGVDQEDGLLAIDLDLYEWQRVRHEKLDGRAAGVALDFVRRQSLEAFERAGPGFLACISQECCSPVKLVLAIEYLGKLQL